MSEKSPEELYAERVKRVLDVAALRVPDRVPVFGPHQLYPYTFAGVTFKDAMNDYALAREAAHKFQDYFQFDLDFGPILAYPAPAMEMLTSIGSGGPDTGWATTSCTSTLRVKT